jgi:hypothetical protein
MTFLNVSINSTTKILNSTFTGKTSSICQRNFSSFVLVQRISNRLPHLHRHNHSPNIHHCDLQWKWLQFFHRTCQSFPDSSPLWFLCSSLPLHRFLFLQLTSIGLHENDNNLHLCRLRNVHGCAFDVAEALQFGDVGWGAEMVADLFSTLFALQCDSRCQLDWNFEGFVFAAV